jgi:uncharacterized coiled-coil protein SlyX
MDEYQESNGHNQNGLASARADANRWLVTAVVALLGIAAVTFAYGLHQQSLVRQLTAQTATANAAVNQMQGQLNAMTAKLSDMTTAQTSPQAPAASPTPPDASVSEPPVDSDAKTPESASTPTPATSAKSAPAKRHVAKRRAPVVDKKYVQLQSQLAEQQKQLKETQDEVAKNRSELEGTINSTRDDLNGSIAKTHDELVALEKRGERSYFEFDLSKSKQFQRVGPLTLSLRKADTKHKSYDVAMIVDDNELQKRKVNLYEPIWIHAESDSQPVQIIVNRIDKDTVHGYISAPKYKSSELSAIGSASVTPVSTKSPANAPVPPQAPQPQQ